MRPRPLVCAAVAALALLSACSSSGGPAGAGAGTPPATSDGTAPNTASASARAGEFTGRDWPQYHGDAQRSGLASDMSPVHGPLTVTQRLRLDGAVYAAPLIADGITVVATENDTVYGFGGSFHQKWKAHLGTPSPARERPCGNIDPLGITGTPVVSGGVVYVAAEFGDPVRHQLVALDLATGAVRWRTSLDLPGVQTVAMQERGALTVTGGRVWVPFGGLAGDCGGYKGRVIGVQTGGSHATVSYTVPTSREAGIWTPPGPSVDKAGHLFVAVGNGAAGRGDAYDHSDSVLELGPDASLVDSFSPSTWPTDNEADLDLGSQGPALVGTWVFTAGKSGTAYVLRQGQLGGIGGQVSKAQVCKSFGGTAVDGDVVYVPCADGVRAVRIDSAGTMHVLWHAGQAITGSPVVGGGRVWSLDQSGGVLHALDPKTGASREQVAVGVTSRFATPALFGGDVLVPTMSGLTVVTAS